MSFLCHVSQDSSDIPTCCLGRTKFHVRKETKRKNEQKIERVLGLQDLEPNGVLFVSLEGENRVKNMSDVGTYWGILQIEREREMHMQLILGITHASGHDLCSCFFVLCLLIHLFFYHIMETLSIN